ncbi:flagellin N-terminal helical domain-containing protein [Christensenella intestinihominis]|uniref:flagellin N-terminal helical domain-containing protein n=1 Tax=Christensenella intestinihominis TaxID=1851429 RepID=UPI00082C37CE|nr:flagellin [Christensenella intestinihominis]
MRIQNNIMALNTHRQYTINNDNVAKSAEKLSSGYKINRAGDDAAGLAISEKMRSQIRGLNMATKNSQDAISLVQTAEGALQETHTMLQRMNELANQSATGTNQELDRNALAKEFDQLKREINDVAEQTTFNNMKILDGSLSYQGPQRSAATAGINVNETVDPANNTAITHQVTTKGVAAVTAAAGVYDMTIADADLTALTNGDDYEIEIAGARVTFTAGANAGASRTALVAALNGSTDPILSTYTFATQGADGLRLTQDASVTDPNRSAVMGGLKLNGNNYAVSETTKGETAVTAVPGVTTANVNVADLKIGDTLTVGGRRFELVEAGQQAQDGNVGIAWDSTKTNADLVTALQAGIPGGITVAATGAGDGFTVTQAVGGVGDNSVSFKAAAAVQSTIEFDTVKLKTGDQISVKLNGTEYTYEFQQGDSFTNIAQGLRDAAGNVLEAEQKGSALIVQGRVDVMSGFQPVEATGFDAIRIQVGALEGEQLSVSIDSMNTKGLGLDDVSIYTQDTAGKAITATRTAIDKVSDQRAALGAMQNRLDHKIANLKVSSENLTAAESRIRDVDIASEMTAFTKSNILAQAATAMLAQANSLPQNVLSLLR